MDKSDNDWVVMPRFMTPEMADAAWQLGGVTYSQLIKIYRALIESAPKKD